MPSYPGCSPPRTPDIQPLVPRIFNPAYPGYSPPRTPDIHPLVPRIFTPSYPGYTRNIDELSALSAHALFNLEFDTAVSPRGTGAAALAQVIFTYL